jgi:hypothetical protein
MWPRMIKDLKQRIREKVSTNPEEMAQRVRGKLQASLKQFLRNSR